MGRSPRDRRVWSLLASFTRIGLAEAITARRFVIIDGLLTYND